jgi:putative DNA methylase
MINRKKLIEVALPLQAINEAAEYEKKPGIGPHPRGLHHWWARRPFTTARAVIFAQLVDDPSEYLQEPRDIERERDRLLALIAELVQWKNTTNEVVLERARAEIRRSWARQCLGNDAVARMTDKQIKADIESGRLSRLPAFHDPFAGGGALPLEAQRLALEAYASDLNPVAALINKAMIEIPPKFANLPPVNPESQRCQFKIATWGGAQGLAEDIRYYGQWMRDEAFTRIGHLYPKVKVTAEMAANRKDLKPYIGHELTVIACIWARTVRSPNPAFNQVEVPLITSYVLSSRKGKECWLSPVVDGTSYWFDVRVKCIEPSAQTGTKLSRGANFQCILSGSPITPDYIKHEGVAGRLGRRMLAIVCEGNRERVYLPVIPGFESALRTQRPEHVPDEHLPNDPRNFWTVQ